MRTELDLREAFRDLEELAPDPARVALNLRSRPRPPRTRQRWVVAGGVAVAVAAAVTIPVLVRHAGTPVAPASVPRATGAGPAAPHSSATDLSSSPAATTASTTTSVAALRLSFTMRPVPGFVFAPGTVTSEHQEMDVRTTGGGGPTGVVTVDTVGTFDPTEVKGGSPVRIGTRPGYAALVGSPGSLNGRDVLVAWMYADGRWATVRMNYSGGVESGGVESGGPSSAPSTLSAPPIPFTLPPPASSTGTPSTAPASGEPAIAHLQALGIALAEAVDFSAGSEVTLPFRVGHLPEGLHVVGVSGDTHPEGGALALSDDRTPAAPFATPVTMWVTHTTDPDLVFCPTTPNVLTTDSAGADGVDRTVLITVDPGTSARIVTISGHRGCLVHNAAGALVAVQIDVGPAAHLEILVADTAAPHHSDAEWTTVVESVTVAASFADRSTWFPVPAA